MEKVSNLICPLCQKETPRKKITRKAYKCLDCGCMYREALTDEEWANILHNLKLTK